jgi:hypothetical protein
MNMRNRLSSDPMVSTFRAAGVGFAVIWLLSAAVSLGVLGLVVYVALHFIGKVW